MIIIDIEKLSTQDRIELLRKLLDSLHPTIRKDEIERASRMLSKTPVYIVESPDGTSIVAANAASIAKAIESISGKEPDISNVYKLLRGELKSIFGITIKKYFEGGNPNVITD